MLSFENWMRDSLVDFRAQAAAKENLLVTAAHSEKQISIPLN